MQAGDVAELAGSGFKEGLDAGFGRDLEAGLCLKGGGDALGEELAGGQGHVESAGEEALDDFKVGGVEAGDAVSGEGDGEVRLGNQGGRKDMGGEGAGAGAGPEGGFLGAGADDEGSGGEIAEALVAACGKDGDDADDVEEGDLIDVTDEVAGHGLEEADGSA